MNSDILKVENIKEGRENSAPPFYRSPTGNPLTDIITGGKKAYNKLIRLRRFFDVEITMPPAGFGVGISTVTVNHGIKKSVPLATVYTSLLASNVRVSVTAFLDYFILQGVNYRPDSQTVNVRVFIDEIKTKT